MRPSAGSQGARGLALAVTMAREFGVREMAIPTNGNAGADGGPCSRAGIASYAFCPDDTPDINVQNRRPG
jgi:threonine synthase